jgi:nucleotide-binding universal stress UspA family protein
MSKKIVCMIRGGESGRAVQDYAIDLVKGIDGELTFLHVIDVSRLSLENDQLEAPAREELTWLGRVTISLAMVRSRAAGVHGMGEIRYGQLREVIRTYVKNRPTDQLLLGATMPTVPDYEERLAGLKEFAHQLQAEIGVLVDVIEVCPVEDDAP